MFHQHKLNKLCTRLQVTELFYSLSLFTKLKAEYVDKNKQERKFVIQSPLSCSWNLCRIVSRRFAPFDSNQNMFHFPVDTDELRRLNSVAIFVAYLMNRWNIINHWSFCHLDVPRFICIERVVNAFFRHRTFSYKCTGVNLV